LVFSEEGKGSYYRRLLLFGSIVVKKATIAIAVTFLFGSIASCHCYVVSAILFKLHCSSHFLQAIGAKKVTVVIVVFFFFG
jgi:hypothetical protein